MLTPTGWQETWIISCTQRNEKQGLPCSISTLNSKHVLLNVLNWKIMMTIHCFEGSFTNWMHHSYLYVKEIVISIIIIIVFIITIMITVLHSTIFPTACKLKETSASSVSGGIFQTEIFIRPWESEPGRKKGSVWMCVASLPLPVTFCLGHPSLRWDLSSKLNVSLPLSLSFIPLSACSLESQSASHTEVKHDKMCLRDRNS